MYGGFPAEAEPDGAVFGPHHFYLGVLLILLVCWIFHDADDETGPWGIAGLTFLSVFWFALTWPYYPEVGAAGVLASLGVATFAAMRPRWWRYGVVPQTALLLGLFVAWDDALSHAFGWWTPLDSLWARYLHPYVSDPYVPEEVRLPEGVRLPAEVRLPFDLKALVAEQVGRALAVVPL
ncbi:hypothetical protein M0R88_14880 [Halorussus gelatinilyticus]|uniref:Uncharacterized protein n=1 Tax=Halorussus gelatinilyticus TaxID=2937524 RepID=A0A8U0IHQ2_9EURY|nr:hypothetical protein [Halorussus gelatinilyticus]UPV99791.1 hypothetical protein M0R88_14880 [Halorussus gelatinilyticus]